MYICTQSVVAESDFDIFSQISINILAQIIPGTLLPGKPMANMIFKSYSIQTLVEATAFVQDLKLGHYVKVPPRAIFVGMCWNTIMSNVADLAYKP